MASRTKLKRHVHHSPSASTAPANTFVHTLGRFDTRPSLSNVVKETGATCTFAML